MLILSRKEIESLLSMEEVIDHVEAGFRALASDVAVAPERLHLSLPEQDGVLLEMPAFLAEGGSKLLGTKVVSVFENNPLRGLDSVQAIYLLLDAETGLPLALMDARYITAIRTAATSAVATRHMATDMPRRLLVFGSGTQARFHIDAMATLGAVESLTVTSRSIDRAKECAERAAARYPFSCTFDTHPDVQDANLICTCTGSSAPLFDGVRLSPGTHINAVGAFTPSTRELDSAAICRSRVIIDSWDAAGREAGEILIPLSEGEIALSHVRGTLAELVSGKVQGRESDEEITLFKSCGLAIEDLVTAQLAYQQARAAGAGVEVDL